jgi:hypothetical protein
VPQSRFSAQPTNPASVLFARFVVTEPPVVICIFTDAIGEQNRL